MAATKRPSETENWRQCPLLELADHDRVSFKEGLRLAIEQGKEGDRVLREKVDANCKRLAEIDDFLHNGFTVKTQETIKHTINAAIVRTFWWVVAAFITNVGLVLLVLWLTGRLTRA